MVSSYDSTTDWESPSKVILGCIAFVVFWTSAIFPSIPFLPVGRVAGTILSACLMVVFRVISSSQAFQAIDLSILSLLFGTMLISAYLERADLFKHLGVILGWKCRGGRDLLCRVCILSGLSSAILTNDTTCFILTPFLLDLCKKRKFPPKPFLLALATSSNIGSAATAIGNPQNVIIAIEGHVSFLRFFSGIILPVIVGLVINIFSLSFLFWTQLSTGENGLGMAEEFWAWSSIQGGREEERGRNAFNHTGIRRLRTKFRRHFWKDVTENQPSCVSLSPSPLDNTSIAIHQEAATRLNHTERKIFNNEPSSIKEKGKEGYMDGRTESASSCIISMDVPTGNASRSSVSLPFHQDEKDGLEKENAEGQSKELSETMIHATVDGKKLLPIESTFSMSSPPEGDSPSSKVDMDGESINAVACNSQADANKSFLKRSSSHSSYLSFFTTPSPSSSLCNCIQNQITCFKDRKTTDIPFHTSTNCVSDDSILHPLPSNEKHSHETLPEPHFFRDSILDLSFRTLPSALPLTGVAMDVEESAVAEEEASRGVKRTRGVLWKSSIYLVTLGMLACLLAGLDLAWVTVSASVVMIVIDFADATPMLDKVSYSLLIFFACMFITVKGFNQTGIPGELWKSVEPYVRLDTPAGLSLLAVVITLLSNVASNVPTVLLLGPRLAASASQHSNVSVTQAWLMLSWISTVAGNLTLMGSAANLIVSEQARSVSKNRCNLSFFSHLRFGFVSTVVIIAAGIPLIR